jgi:hypothetical protein
VLPLKRLGLIALVAALAAVLLVAADEYACAHRSPFTRDEAIERATNYVPNFLKIFENVDVKNLRRVEEKFDAATKTWLFSYTNGSCEFSIVVNRCSGATDAGSSPGCGALRREHSAVDRGAELRAICSSLVNAGKRGTRGATRG